MSYYHLITDAYFGTGGFEDGSYLDKNRRELEENFNARKARAYYLNYFSSIVDALVDPIFKKEPLRDYSRPEIGSFLADVDCAGTSIQAFMKEAALKAKLLGAVYIVVDNFQELPKNMAEALATRKLPYAYIVRPQQVDSYILDKSGNLLSFTFKDTIEDGEVDATQKWRKVKYTAKTWTITGEDGAQVSSGEHNLGVIPVICFPSKPGIERTIKPPPEFISLAKTAKSLYNKCSLLDQVLYDQTFSILTIPSLEPKDLKIGTDNAITYDGETSKHEPGFISPDAACAATLVKERAALIQEMYRMAGLAFATGTNAESSGASKEWEFERTNQKLADFAANIQRVEIKLLSVFCAWQSIKDGKYSVDYPDDYGVQDTTAELTKAQATLDLNLCQGIKVPILQKVLGTLFPDMSSADYDALVKEVKAKVEDAKQAANNATNIEPDASGVPPIPPAGE